MWIAREANPFGRLSIRNLLLFVAAICAASFAYILLLAPAAHAADVTWNGDSLMYNQKSYVRQADAVQGNSMGLEKGTHLYTYTEDAPTNGGPQKTHFIYFSPSTDPTKATSASYAVYDFTPPDIFKNPTDKKTISLTAKTAEDSKTTSCAVQGIGWIVCPVTDFFAGAMDWLFNVLSGFLTVRPVQTNQTNSLYRAWSYMRNFANVAFVIAFLVIIYSQVSSVGISNYGIKKILPRLIIAAVLVNISYWICAIAIDVSNIIGYSIQDIFISMRNGLVGTEGNSWNVTSWRSITGFVLSGGTALTALGIGTYSALAGAGGAIYLLLPILLGVLMAVLVALLVLAARQAIITILVIVSPLAFVAYILPNTEKYFKRWHELGTTLLVMFPAFSVVFGGAQLAGTAIIQNADSINLLILGMAVQVAPLAITPLLMRVSGSLLTKVAGIANNPKRGMVDRTRNWANSRAEDHKARNLGRSDLKRRNFMARSAQAIDARNRKREGWRKAYEAQADASWENTEEAHKIHAAASRAALHKSVGESAAEAHFEAIKNTDAALQGMEIQARANKLNIDLSKAKMDANWAEVRAGDSRSMVVPESLSVSALAGFAHSRNNLAQSIKRQSEEAEVENLRKHSAERKQKTDLTNSLLANELQIDGKQLRDYAGGVLGEVGAESVLTSAVASERDEYRSRVKEKTELINHFNLSATQRQKLALGQDVETEKDGVTYMFRKNDDFAREAAIDQQLKKGSFSEVQAIIAESGEQGEFLNKETNQIEVRQGTTYKYRTSIRDAVKDYSLDKKANFFGAQTIDDISLGKISGEKGLNMAAARAIFTGKISDDDVSGMKAAALSRLFKVTEDDVRRSEAYNKEGLSDAQRAEIIADFHTNQQALRYSAWNVVHTPMLLRNAEKEAADVLKGAMQQPPPSP